MAATVAKYEDYDRPVTLREFNTLATSLNEFRHEFEQFVRSINEDREKTAKANKKIEDETQRLEKERIEEAQKLEKERIEEAQELEKERTEMQQMWDERRMVEYAMRFFKINQGGCEYPAMLFYSRKIHIE